MMQIKSIFIVIIFLLLTGCGLSDKDAIKFISEDLSDGTCLGLHSIEQPELTKEILNYLKTKGLLKFRSSMGVYDTYNIVDKNSICNNQIDVEYEYKNNVKIKLLKILHLNVSLRYNVISIEERLTDDEITIITANANLVACDEDLVQLLRKDQKFEEKFLKKINQPVKVKIKVKKYKEGWRVI